MPPQNSTPVRRASYFSTCAVPAVHWIDLFNLVLTKQSSIASLCRQHRLPETVFQRRLQRFKQAKQVGAADDDALKSALLDRRCYSRRALTDEQEQLIVQSIDNSNQARMPINYNYVKLQATQLYKDTHPHALRDVTNFQASNGFIEGFKQRHCTVTRTASTISRLSNKTLTQQERNATEFLSECQRIFRSLPDKYILNLDETQSKFAPVPRTTLTRSGSDPQKIVADTTGSTQTNGITAVPIVAADGTKLKATFVKKGLTERSVRDCQKPDRLMCWSDNGWVNNGVMQQIIDQVIVPHVRPPSRSCLIMDSFSAHQTECIRDKLDRINCELLIVPAGQTGKYQPLDVGVFSVVKKRCENLWLAEQRGERTSTGNATIDGVNRFSDAYSDLSRETVKSAFEKAIKHYFVHEDEPEYE